MGGVLRDGGGKGKDKHGKWAKKGEVVDIELGR